MRPSHRRDFLKTLLGGAAGISFSTTVLGQGVATPITVTKIADNFALITNHSPTRFPSWLVNVLITEHRINQASGLKEYCPLDL